MPSAWCGAAMPAETYKFEASDLSRVFRSGRKETIAVDRVNFKIKDREIISLVGQSGCGKTVLAKMLLRLRRQFRPAAQARPVAGRAGCRGGGVITHVGRFGRWRRAHRAAIDAGTAHGGEEQPVEACIARQAGAVALGPIGHEGLHGASLCPRPGAGWPFSDRVARAGCVHGAVKSSTASAID